MRVRTQRRLSTKAFKLWCWRRLLRVPWTAWRSNQSILKEIKFEYSLDWCWSWSSNPLATWYKETNHWKIPWCWERLKAEGEGATEDEMVRCHHWLNGHEFEQTLGDSEGQGSLEHCSPWVRKEFWTWLSYWTTTTRGRVLCEKWQVLETDKFGFIHPLSSVSAVWPWTC